MLFFHHLAAVDYQMELKMIKLVFLELCFTKINELFSQFLKYIFWRIAHLSAADELFVKTKL